MSDISYKQVEQAIEILELEAALTAAENKNKELISKLNDLEILSAQLSEIEREKECQRLDLLAAQCTAQLAEAALAKG